MKGNGGKKVKAIGKRKKTPDHSVGSKVYVFEMFLYIFSIQMAASAGATHPKKGQRKITPAHSV